jgi:uncharacterized protein YyaL (SSP411 family)
MYLRSSPWLLAALLLLGGAGTAAAEAPAADGGIHWNSGWNPALFAQASREHRYVLLDLQAVWCHWCHVMDQQTYADPEVTRLIGAHYLAVKVDQDSDPALSSRYGDWGWPATIVLAADGGEIVKRRGYIPPRNMASLLQAIVDDPSPGPSVVEQAPIKAAVKGELGEAQRQQLSLQYEQAYSSEHGGWGDALKYVDAPALELALEHAQRGDAAAEHMARQTLDANLALIDPVWGGVYQYSEKPDWSAPHYEKIMSYQADDLRLYAMAYARWRDPRYLHAAQAIHGYLDNFLRSPDGAYYVSEDADLNAATSGHVYYALSKVQRLALGLPPIDRHLYARENGWAIAALCRYSDASGDSSALHAAQDAAQWIAAHRGLSGGGFRHGEAKDGPFLGDTAAMAEAFLALYRSTGDRAWLRQSLAALAFIEAHFGDGQAGFDTAAPIAKAHGVFARPVRLYEENVAVTRTANMAYRYTADARWQRLAQHGMRYLAAPALADSGHFLPGVLLADEEFTREPVHITVVGAKDDEAALALHAAALRYPADFLRIDWWDKREGPLPNPDVKYPSFAKAAAYACSARACSSPVFDADKLGATVDGLPGAAGTAQQMSRK